MLFSRRRLALSVPVLSLVEVVEWGDVVIARHRRGRGNLS